jgi:hypothetical protein
MREARIERGVRHHDGRRLAAELQGDLGDVVRRRAHHGDAGLHAAGQADHVDLRVGGKGVADDRSGAGDEVEDALGKRGLGHELREGAGVVGSLAAGLDDDRVPRDEGGGHLAHQHEEGEVPRHHPGDDADRQLVDEDVLSRAVALDDLALVAAGELGHVVDVVGGEVHLHLGQREDLALFLGDDGGQLVPVPADQLGDLAQVAGTHDRGQLAPFLLRSSRGSDGGVDVGRGPPRDLGDHLGRGRVDHRERLVGTDELAVDQHLVAAYSCVRHHSPFPLPALAAGRAG